MSYRLGKFDLAQETLEMIEVPQTLYRAFIGGAGLAAAVLFPTLRKELDPLSGQAPLLLATGPLTGTTGPSVGRFVICGKSPATGLWAESNIGGFTGPELRAAGFDGLWIHGRADAPVYLWVTDGRVETRSANHLWGAADTFETQDLIRRELSEPSAKVLTIGIAGENQVPFSVILGDHGRVAGRTGMGAVMGSKNLKAIAIRGSQPIPIADQGSFKATRSRVNRELRDDLVSAGLRDFGTASASDLFDYFGLMPKKYYSSGTLSGTEKVSGATLSETILSGVSTCHGCVIACGRKVRLGDDIERKGPEYETVIGFGPNLGITDLELISILGDRCDRLGMDTISFTNILGMVIYLYQNGLIDETDTEGSTFEWDDGERALQMLEDTARCEGFGAKLALGARELASIFGAMEHAAQVKGLEAAYHDPRGASGVGLVYATSPRGACHNQGHYYMVEIGQTMEAIGVGLLGRQDIDGKSANVARHQDWTSLLNSLVLCILANVPAEDTLALLNHATGWGYDLEQALQAGERIWNLKRIINYRLGARAEHDRLPSHFLKPLEDGGSAGIVPPMDELLARYYSVRGWDPSSGLPSLAVVKRLGLESYLDEASG